MKRFWIVSLLLSLALFSGCSGLDAEELYCPPEAPEAYYTLQDALSEVLSQGLSYHAPAAGTRREPVQLVDLDGDGVEEAVAFFRTGEGAVKTYIFANQDGVYEQQAVIDSAGVAVASVDYADLTGTGDLELLISCQVSETVTQALQVCRYGDGGTVTLSTVSCNRSMLTDLDGDGAQELVCLVDNGADPCVLSFYRFLDGKLTSDREIKLSSDYSSVLELECIRLTDQTRALVISSAFGESEMVYDLFTLKDGVFSAVHPQEDLLHSDRARGGVLYPRDIDGDGLQEIPKMEQLAAYGEGTTPQCVTLWYGFNSSGKAKQKAVTYHDFDNGWYLDLPESWVGAFLVKQNDTATAVNTVSSAIFYHLKEDGTPGDEILTLYTLKGANRQTLAEEQKLSILYSDNEVTYAFSLPKGAQKWDGSITMAQVSDGFHME